MKINANRILSLLLSLLFITLIFPIKSSAAGDVWDGGFQAIVRGSGTADDPLLIENAKQLAFLARAVNSDESYSSKHFKLIDDIVLNDISDVQLWNDSYSAPNSWTPIGTDSKPFSGVFDGNGYSVIGLYISKIEQYKGLFGYVEGGDIKGLTIGAGFISGAHYIGAVAGYTSGSITDCFNNATVKGYDDVGGIVGSSVISVNDCVNNGKVSARNRVGGIVGTGMAAECVNNASVNGCESVGGICGLGSSNALTELCVNNGSVYASGSYAGGICGFVRTACVIRNSFNTASVSSEGICAGIVSENNQSNIDCCYNTGLVSGNAITSVVYAGTVEYCYYLEGCKPDSEGEDSVPLTAEQMKLAESFYGFDFDTVWSLGNNPDYLYPELHKYSKEWTIDKEPTLFEVGEKSHHCIHCGKTRSDITEIPRIVPDCFKLTDDSVFSINDDNVITGISLGVTTAQLKQSFVCYIDYLIIYSSDGEKILSTRKKLGTGMVLRIVDGERIADEATVSVYGDVNGDSELTVDDARSALRGAVGLEKLSNAQKLAGDVDGKAGVTVDDARRLLRISVGLEQL